MRQFLFAVLVAAFASPVAASEAQVDALWSELRFADYAPILIAEGEEYGKSLGDSLFPGEAGPGWTRTVRQIYASDAMLKVLSREFHRRLDHEDMGKAVAFYQSKTGSRSVELEISARKALLDPDIEAANLDRMHMLQIENDPRFLQIEKFSDVNALVENNVMSTMNGNYAFLSAMTRAGEGPYTRDPGAILGSVWQQEDEIRHDTEEWVLSFFTFAYSPLSDDEVQQLIDFSGTEQGRKLNEALFATFDTLFDGLSSQLGTAAAQYMKGERL